MNSKKIAVLGGDTRQKYIITSLEKRGYCVSKYGIAGDVTDEESIIDAVKNSDALLLPYPVSPDGVYLNAVCEECNVKLSELFALAEKEKVPKIYGGGFKSNVLQLANAHGITVFDYAQSEAVLIRNALCTAEGAIEIAMRELPINIHGSKCAVIGYGRIGRLIAQRMHALGATVNAVARKHEARVTAEIDGAKAFALEEKLFALKNADVIFNTVPSLILDGKALASLTEDQVIIDLASSPGGVDFTKAEALGKRVIWALSLPGKYAPRSAAEIIVNAVHEDLDLTRKC